MKMSYSIIFETKVVKLSDGRLLHLDLSGCNNDNSGRNRGEFTGKIYTVEDFVKKAEKFKENSKPINKSEDFDLKIGSKFSTMYDYGEHLLRMMKRAVTWDELAAERYCSGTVFDGVILYENGKEALLAPDEWERICYDFLYGKRKSSIRRLTHSIDKEDEIIEALKYKKTMNFYISRKV